MEKKMNNKGFSLVELIVVIAIMAVLVGVLAPQFIKYVEKSRQSTDITNLDSIKTVVESYYADKEGTELPHTVEISPDNGVYVVKANGVSDNKAVEQGGVANTKVKGTWQDGPKATWAVTANTWTYVASSNYYTVSNNVIKTR